MKLHPVYVAILFFSFPLQLSTKENNLLDRFHHTVSQKVITLAHFTDKHLERAITSFFSAKQNGTTKECKEVCFDHRKPKIYPNDRFFKTRKDEIQGDQLYIMLRGGSTLFERASNEPDASMKIRFPFLRCKQTIKLLIEDDFKQQGATQKSGETIAIGIDSGKRLYKQLRVGLNRGDPYATLYLSKPFDLHDWLIEPIASLSYLTKGGIQQGVDLFADKQIAEAELFRLHLFALYKKEEASLSYNLRLSYFVHANSHSGWHLFQDFSGSKSHLNDSSFSGISTYKTTFLYRTRLFREWIVTEVAPFIRFAREDGYKRELGLQLFLEFYFGYL